MKNILFLTSLIMSFFTIHAQSDTLITVSHTNTVKEISKQTIYEKVKLWSVNTFENVSDGLQLDDKESGILVYDASTQELSPNAPKTNVAWKLIDWYYKYTFQF